MTQKTNNNGKGITPAQQADYLSRHGHLLGIVNDCWYYSMGDSAYKVIVISGVVAQVNKMSIAEAERIVACSDLSFGGF